MTCRPLLLVLNAHEPKTCSQSLIFLFVRCRIVITLFKYNNLSLCLKNVGAALEPS